MKYQLEVTYWEEDLRRFGPRSEEIIRRRMIDEIADKVVDQLKIEEVEQDRPDKTDFRAEFVFMPAEQWEHVKSMLRVISAFGNSSNVNTVKEVIYEIENK